jgi:transcriptional regulator with XRE-family HTH domain
MKNAKYLSTIFCTLSFGSNMNIQTIGKQVRHRRQAVGLTQQRLAKLADLSRQTIQRLEAGTINDLSFQRIIKLLGVLGLSFDGPSLTSRQRKNGLWMAAKTSSVSYRDEITSEQLEKALASGKAVSGFEANLLHFLDEAPIQVVVMAIEETAQRESVEPAKIWSNVATLAHQLGAVRSALWA